MSGNVMLPGNPRYQPKDLQTIFGYDYLVRAMVEVELAAIDTLAEAGVVPEVDYALLTDAVRADLLRITTTEVDVMERSVTKHDIRALVRVMQERMPPPLRRWVHVPLTSYDVIDTARTLQYMRAHEVVFQKARTVVLGLLRHAREHADTVQIGRTHGQHALPITVGFWFVSIAHRMYSSMTMMAYHSEELCGKISGAVGVYNAQAGLKLTNYTDSFEQKVLERLGIKPAPISTQILQPEPLAFYLHACLMLSSTLGQFGRDARHLMRSEIRELAEPFDSGQVGSSTMAHKRNPLNFENLEGMWLRTKNEYGKVLDSLISEHQRDLVGSSIARDFPIILVNLAQQLDTLLRPGKDGRSFLERISVDTEACRRNLEHEGDRILAEPMYLALQLHGYEGDAHEVVNHRAMPLVGSSCSSLFEAMEHVVRDDPQLQAAWEAIPHDIIALLKEPAKYTGLAAERTFEMCHLLGIVLEK